MTVTTRAPLTSPRLRQLVARGPAETTQRAAADPTEVCELCTAPVPPEHRHLIDLDTRELVCACRACALLFDRTAAGNGHLRLVPDRRLGLDDFVMADELWERLRIPVEIAFFFASSRAERVMALLPESARADRVAPGARRMAGARGREPGARHHAAGMSRRCSSTGRAARGASGSCRSMTPTGSSR